MSSKNTATIISYNNDFFKKYEKQLKSFFYKINQIHLPKDLNNSLIVNVNDCYFLDNTNNNFPFEHFLNSLNDSRANPFLITIGSDPPDSIKNSHLLYSIRPDINDDQFCFLIKNAEHVINREKAQIELTSMLLHDVRSPLNSMIGYLELLINGTFGELQEGQKNILEKAMEMGDFTLDLLEDLSEIYKNEQSTLLIQKQIFEINTLIESVLLNVWVKADSKNIQIKKNILSDVKKLWGDDFQIQRLLTNLLNNSIKYCPNNSRILIDAHLNKNNDTEISIIDNGQGVPDEQLPYLFDKYYRVKQKNKIQKGHGLGLYVCKIIIQAHKGKIWADNNKNGGLTVTFTLPSK
jgi:signal transduction histidine kinase